MLKDYLVSKNVLYDEKLVDMDDNAQKQMASVSGGFMGVPFVLIEKTIQFTPGPRPQIGELKRSKRLP